jgi:hypothetical protein
MCYIITERHESVLTRRTERALIRAEIAKEQRPFSELGEIIGF